VIEAYDQPWKRQLEGTVGGHWGLFDAYTRKAKFTWGAPVSEHPDWTWQAAGGVVLAALAFAAAWLAGRGMPAPPTPGTWVRIGGGVLVSGALAGWTIANVPIESLTAGDWLRSLMWAAVALLSPVLAAAALASGVPIASVVQVLGRAADRKQETLALALGALLIVLIVLAVQAALGLVFDPRYRDFPFAPLWGATVPLLLATTMPVRLRRPDPLVQWVAAAVLVLSAVYIVVNETLANWQAVWFCGGLIVLALTLLRVRDAPG
jgi:glucan 1,3-beta-glucosidase